jgi:hypothetical protein
MPRRQRRADTNLTPEEAEALRRMLFKRFRDHARRLGRDELERRLDERLGPGWRASLPNH